MIKYILGLALTFILIFVNSSGHTSSSFSAEFSTKEACLDIAREMASEFDYPVFLRCTPKGDVPNETEWHPTK